MRAYQRFAKRAIKLDLSCRDCDPNQPGLCFTLCAGLGAADRMVSSFFLSEALAKDIAAKNGVAHEEPNGALTKSWLEFFSIVGRYLELELELKGEQKVQVSITGGFVQQPVVLPDQGLLLGLNASRAQIVLHVGLETASA